MSRIDDLIKQFCPDGVEYKAIGDIVDILDSQRRPVSKEKRIQGQYPYYGANGVQDYVNEYIFDGTFLLVGEDGSVINKDNTPVLNWATGKIWVNNHAHILQERPNGTKLRYVYFCLSCTNVFALVKGMPPKLNQQNLKSITIPVPPLPVQEEIVRILDNFSKLEAELEAELEARKKQYEHYRNQMLSFDEGGDDAHSVEMLKLGDLCDISTGTKPSVILDEVADYEYINAGTSNSGYVSDYNCRGDVVTTPSRGQGGIGFVGYQSKDFWLGPLVYQLRSKNTTKLLNKYLYYALCTRKRDILRCKKEGGVPAVNSSDIKNIQIPVPLLAEQERIMAILDKFDALVNDISVGLPAEIAARRKQYEYYRNKLLDFKKAE